MKTRGENIQDNNGTKMATAPAMGRPLASRPPLRPSERRMAIRRFHWLSFDRMTTGMRRWSRQADLRRRRHHHHRYANTVSRLSTSASPPLPLSHQTLRRADVWLPLFIVTRRFHLMTHFLAIFFLFPGPFIMVFWLLI